jgi:hypothetical protein
MRKGSFGVIAAVLSLCVAACSHAPPRRADPGPPPKHPVTEILLVYAAPDGSLTRAQMEAGLKRDFDKIDLNHNGCLDDKEVRAINEQRWKEDAATATPLIDFKRNGCLDFDEYAAAARSLFDQLDRDGTGKLTAQQLRPGSKPAQPAQGGGDAHPHGKGGQGQPPQGQPSGN